MRWTVLLCCSIGFCLTADAQSAKVRAYRLGAEGIVLIDDGQYAAGIKLLKQSRNLDPREYDYPFEIGRAYLKSGDPKKAERYLFGLQYHVHASPELYLLLAECYAGIEKKKPKPDIRHKKQLAILNLGIKHFPSSGKLYLRLGKALLALKKSSEALFVWETGIGQAPNFAENYYWAARLLFASDHLFWAWRYGEIFMNMTADAGLRRAIAPVVYKSADSVLALPWTSGSDGLENEILKPLNNCASPSDGADLITAQTAMRRCLADGSLPTTPYSPLIDRMRFMESQGWTGAYVANLCADVQRGDFLEWLRGNERTFAECTEWLHQNPLSVARSVSRIK